MHSLANPSIPDEQFMRLKALLNCENLDILTTAAGGNSKVFCANADGKKWAVKSYPPFAPNQRDRLIAESTIYQFLNQHLVPCVPQFKQACQIQRLLIIDWIEGDVPASTSITSDDIHQAVQFIAEIAKLNALPAAKTLPLAAEACLSLDMIIDQIQERLERLKPFTADEPSLKEFLDNLFTPLLITTRKRAREGYKSLGFSTSAELAIEKRSLIPADFGFHNSLRNQTGKLHFFDFDYFGWDDPVKLLADVLWHPKMALTETQEKQFINGIAAVYRQDEEFLLRFHHTLPLFGLRWVLILLNEFIPAFWQNRQHAAVHDNLALAKEKQLNLATELLMRI